MDVHHSSPPQCCLVTVTNWTTLLPVFLGSTWLITTAWTQRFAFIWIRVGGPLLPCQLHYCFLLLLISLASFPWCSNFFPPITALSPIFSLWKVSPNICHLIKSDMLTDQAYSLFQCTFLYNLSYTTYFSYTHLGLTVGINVFWTRKVKCVVSCMFTVTQCHSLLNLERLNWLLSHYPTTVYKWLGRW